MRFRTRRRTLQRRRGAVLVEFAFALPFLLLLLLGTLDACNLLFLKNSLRTAAHEAVHRAVADELSSNEAVEIAARYLEGLGVQAARIETSPNEIKKAERGEYIQVTISATASSQAMFLRTMLNQLEIRAAAAIAK